MYNKQFDKAEAIFNQALNTRKKILDKKDPFYVSSYILFRKLSEEKQEYNKALQYQDTVILLTKDADGQFHPNHLIELSNKANIYEKIAEFDNAIEIRKLVLEQHFKKDELSNESFDNLYFLAGTYRKKGAQGEAIKLYELISKNTKKKTGKSIEYAQAQSTLGVVLFEAGNYSKSKSCYIESIDIFKSLGAENTSYYGLVLNNLAVLYYNLGDFFSAEQYYLKAREIRKTTIGENHPDFVYTLNGLAVLYHESGNYKKAEPLYLRSLQILENQKFGKESLFTVLTNLGELYEYTDRFNEAADTYTRAYKEGMELYGKNNIHFAKLLKKIAGFYKSVREYAMADTLYHECIDAIENSIGKNNPDYAGVLNNRGQLYIQTKEYKKAEKDLLESASLTKKLFGEFHYQYSVLQNNLAALYFETGQKKKCEKNLIRANETIINKVNESVNYMTGQESEAFLKSTDYIFDTYYSYYFKKKNDNPALTGFAYDNVLARKGLMLQTEKNLRKSVLQTGDSTLIRNYLEFISLKEKQGKLFTTNQQLNEASINEINEKAQELEKKLTTNSKIISSRAQINIAGWNDIKKSLQKDEAAIEFIAFNYRNLLYTDSTYYCALILKPEYKYPKMVFLFEERQLDSLLKKEGYYSDEEFVSHLYHKTTRKQEGYVPENDSISTALYDLIWKPLERHVNGVETIYYSPGGLLHNISFAALSVDDSTYVSDKYKLTTLISTRSLIAHERYTGQTDYKVSLYGGIEYDIKPEQIKKLTKSYKKDSTLKKNNDKVKLLTQTINRGANWSYLHGTLEETEVIEALFKAQKVDVESYKGENAIEETFKQYTGNIISPNIIHIATHGFFIQDPETNSNAGISEEDFNAFQVSEDPLFRSGLLFAGANRSWNNLEMPDDSEDGILTAYEVSNTNLINTELVVLSACETGLGEIKGSEGVYGLQRSFKIAGAEYVIMSLWQIPDYQTVELMKHFYTYKNLNFTIPEAFNLAQNEMKRKYLPYYWAAFVLLK